MRLGKVWIELDGALEMPDGRLHAVLIGQDDSEGVVGRRKSRIGTQGFFHFGLSVLQSALLQVKMAEVVVCLGIDGPCTYGALILLRGPRKLACLYQQSGQIVVRFRHVRVFANHLLVLIAGGLNIAE